MKAVRDSSKGAQRSLCRGPYWPNIAGRRAWGSGSIRGNIMRRIIIASLLALMPFCARVEAQQAEPQKINVAIAFVASSTLPMWVAQDEGLFKKYGLDAKLISFQGSAAATQA